MEIVFGDWTSVEEHVADILSVPSSKTTFPFPNEAIQLKVGNDDRQANVFKGDDDLPGTTETGVLCNGAPEMLVATTTSLDMQPDAGLLYHQPETQYSSHAMNSAYSMPANMVVSSDSTGFMEQRHHMEMAPPNPQHPPLPYMSNGHPSILNPAATEFVPRCALPHPVQVESIPQHRVAASILPTAMDHPTPNYARSLYDPLMGTRHHQPVVPVTGIVGLNMMSPAVHPMAVLPPPPMLKQQQRSSGHGAAMPHIMLNQTTDSMASITVPTMSAVAMQGEPTLVSQTTNKRYQPRNHLHQQHVSHHHSAPTPQIQILKKQTAVEAAPPQHEMESAATSIEQAEVTQPRVVPDGPVDSSPIAVSQSEPVNKLPNSEMEDTGLSFGFFTDDIVLGKGKNDSVQLLTGSDKTKAKHETPTKSGETLSTVNDVSILPPTTEPTSADNSVTLHLQEHTSPVNAAAKSQQPSTTPVSPPTSAPQSPPSPSAVPQSPPQAAAPQAPKSWANLFSGAANPSSQGPGVKVADTLSSGSSHAANVPPPVMRPSNDFGAILSNFQLKTSAVSLQARRLINQANWCYVNATLQALLACPPFYHIIKALPSYPALSHQKSPTPVIDAVVEFVNEFAEVKYERNTDRSNVDKVNKRRKDLTLGEPFEPSGVYNVLSVMKTTEQTFQQGKQEDAEEFLTCFLNKLHDEMGESVKRHKKKLAEEGLANGNGEIHDHSESEPSHSDDDGEQWEQVGPRNKSVVTHSNVDKMTTPISEIFGGLLRSSLSTGASSKESAVLEPFFTVPLNVQTNQTVEDALKSFVSKEVIDGYTCPQTKQETDAYRRLTFEQLPPILILHLKCFVYDTFGGSQKVQHTMNFSTTLEFDKELFSSQARGKYMQKEKRSYRLFAVVYHSGNKTTGGHYHTDVYHIGVRSWVKFDDNSVVQIDERKVLDFKHPSVPYLLYYKRVDTIQTSTATHGAVGSHNTASSKHGANYNVLNTR